MRPSDVRSLKAEGNSSLTPFELYREYLGLKRHFSDWSYDYERFGCPNVRPETFEKRTDKFRFKTLAQKPLARWCVLSSLASRDCWIGDISSEESRSAALASWGRVESISEALRTELDDVDPRTIIRPGGEGRHPELALRVMSGKMSREVAAIMVGVSGCVRLWRRDFPGDPVMNDLSLRLSRYYPLLPIDKKKAASVVREVLKRDK